MNKNVLEKVILKLLSNPLMNTNLCQRSFGNLLIWQSFCVQNFASRKIKSVLVMCLL